MEYKKLWERIVTTESESNRFDFIHNMDLPVIQLIKYNSEGEKVSQFWMNYEEWEELCRLTKRLTQKYDNKISQ